MMNHHHSCSSWQEMLAPLTSHTQCHCLSHHSSCAFCPWLTTLMHLSSQLVSSCPFLAGGLWWTLWLCGGPLVGCCIYAGGLLFGCPVAMQLSYRTAAGDLLLNLRTCTRMDPQEFVFVGFIRALMNCSNFLLTNIISRQITDEPHKRNWSYAQGFHWLTLSRARQALARLRLDTHHLDEQQDNSHGKMCRLNRACFHRNDWYWGSVREMCYNSS